MEEKNSEAPKKLWFWSTNRLVDEEKNEEKNVEKQITDKKTVEHPTSNLGSNEKCSDISSENWKSDKNKDAKCGIYSMNYVETLIHILKGNLGSGLFAMGDAVKNAGIIFGPIMIVFLGILCTHCEHLLLSASTKMSEKMKSEGQDELRLDFAETVEQCFAHGTPRTRRLSKLMKTLVNFLLCVTQLGFCCVYFIFIASNTKKVADTLGFEMDIHLHMVIIFLPIVLSILVRNLKYLAPLSAFANVCLGVGVIITLYFVCQDIPPIKERKYIGNIGDMPLFFGTALFAFEGIGLVLPLRNEMKKPRHFTKPYGVLNIGMVLVTCMFVTLGFLSYLKYGEDIESSVTLNLPQENWLAQAVQIIIALAITFTYALQFYIPLDATLPSVLKTFSGLNPLFVEYTYRILLCILTFILAEFIPYLNHFISLVGAVSSTALALMFPPIIEFAIAEKVTKWMIFKNSIILIVAVIGFVTGTIVSIQSIIQAFKNEDLHL